MAGTQRIVAAALAAALAGWPWTPAPAAAQEADLPPHLADRGTGIHTSLFGTYVEAGQTLFYAFYEHTRSSAFEYKPSELGHAGGGDHLGKLVEREFLVFAAHGFGDRLMVEAESALHTRADFDKAPGDTSATPATLRESGLGDTEGQVRYRWLEETAGRPELVSYFQVVLPLQRDKVLMGTQHWELAAGVNVTRGFPFGTLMAKAGLAWDAAQREIEAGEFGAEYVRRLTPRWRAVAALEGESDELSAIGEAQYALTRRATLKLNCGFGLTRKAPDVAPEIGVLFAF